MFCSHFSPSPFKTSFCRSKTPMFKQSCARVLYQLAVTRQSLDGVAVEKQSYQDTWDQRSNISMLVIYVCTGNLKIVKLTFDVLLLYSWAISLVTGLVLKLT